MSANAAFLRRVRRGGTGALSRRGTVWQDKAKERQPGTSKSFSEYTPSQNEGCVLPEGGCKDSPSNVTPSRREQQTTRAATSRSTRSRGSSVRCSEKAQATATHNHAGEPCYHGAERRQPTRARTPRGILYGRQNG